MKEYHTEIEFNAPIERVWNVLTDFESYGDWNPLVSKLTGYLSEGQTIETTIVPLQKTFRAKLLSFEINKELIWKGKQGASFLLSGEHYYRLNSKNDNHTILEHGEYFTGILSMFIPKKLLKKMKNAFVEHNKALKKRIENEE